MKLVLLTIISASLGFEGIAHGQGLPVRDFDSLPPAGSAPTFTRGPARFQVLDDALVRMEYAPNGGFVDAPSVAVINRDRRPQTLVRSGESNGWLTIKTPVLELRYKLDSGPFTKTNLCVE